MAERRLSKVDPPELGALLDLAERPRAGDWSLRAALTRFAQPEPERVAALLDLVRRMDAAASADARTFTSDGPRLWDELQSLAAGGDTSGAGGLVGLLAAMAEVDRLGDVLAAWANDWSTDRPVDRFDAVVADVRQRLTDLGVAEQGPPPPGVRGRGRG